MIAHVAQANSLARFVKKLPRNAKDNLSIQALPNSGVAIQALSLGKVPGSSAIYEKQVDAWGQTIQFTKTTYDQNGDMIMVKDKLTGEVYECPRTGPA